MNQLFRQVHIRSLTLKNRIAVPAMIRYHWAKEDGLVSDLHLWHYEVLAKGGQGLIIQEATAISPAGRWVLSQLGIWQNSQLNGLRRLVDIVHQAGGKIIIQLHHAGVRALKPVGPSEYKVAGFNIYAPSNTLPQTTCILSLDEIYAIQDDFAAAAYRAMEAGYDGIELHGAHGYLISNFLNKNGNRRTDAYGADRSRFVTETLRKIREAIGPEPIVGIRMGGFEPSLTDGLKNARILEAAGFDFLNVSYGDSRNIPDQLPEKYPFSAPFYAASMVKREVTVPVLGAYGAATPQTAENILVRCGIDAVCVGRGVLVNSNWANDALAGREAGVCLNCKVCQWRFDYTKCPGRLLYQKLTGTVNQGIK